MLERIKQYLGIDFNDDDALLQTMEQTAYAYLDGAIARHGRAERQGVRRRAPYGGNLCAAAQTGA